MRLAFEEGIRHRREMGKKWRIGVLILLTLIAVGFIWSLSRPREPLYNGKTVSQLLRATTPNILADGTVILTERDRPTDSNAVPALIKALKTKDGTMHRFYAWIWSKSPDWMKTRLPMPVPDTVIRGRAIQWLRRLGAQARPAIVALIEVMKHDAHSGTRGQALQALAEIDEKNPAIRAALIEATKDQDLSLRIEALELLNPLPNNDTPFTP